MKWITRKNIKVDRVACPWLIQRFIDPDAEFLFVEEAQLLDIAAREGAIPFDALYDALFAYSRKLTNKEINA